MVSRWHQLIHSSTAHHQQQQQQQKAASNAAAAATCSPDTKLHGDALKTSSDNGPAAMSARADSGSGSGGRAAAAAICDSRGVRGCGDPVVQGLDEPQRVSVLGRAKTRVLRQLGELEAQLGVQQEVSAEPHPGF